MGTRTKHMAGRKPSATGQRKTHQEPQLNTVSDGEVENINPMSPGSPTPISKPRPLVRKVPNADGAEDATAAEALLSLSNISQ